MTVEEGGGVGLSRRIKYKKSKTLCRNGLRQTNKSQKTPEIENKYPTLLASSRPAVAVGIPRAVISPTAPKTPVRWNLSPATRSPAVYLLFLAALVMLSLAAFLLVEAAGELSMALMSALLGAGFILPTRTWGEVFWDATVGLASLACAVSTVLYAVNM
jgi:hypothetical protein